MTQDIYIVSAKRTAIGTLLGTLSTVAATTLGSEVIKAILEETLLPINAIDQVVLGQVITGGAGQNPARQSLIKAGLPVHIPAITVNMVCGSGLKAVALAANAIRAGESEIILAGGQENMSLGMHGLYIRTGQKFGNSSLIDFTMYDGLTDAFSGVSMGITGENIAKKYNISRKMQDEFAFNSQQKAANAQKLGKFKDEIVPIKVRMRKEEITVETDDNIRADTTIEALSKLKPAFDQSGTVTAGNSSAINDGAACLLIASSDMVRKYNLKPLARIVSSASIGVLPEIMGIGPVPASKKALSLAGWKIEDLDLIEANEAFAVQACYVNQEMGWNPDIVNVNGGAVALGHPIGASGARILVTLLHEMRRRNAKKALATLCIGGGMGIAMCLENVN